MPEKPTYRELERRIADLETQLQACQRNRLPGSKEVALISHEAGSMFLLSIINNTENVIYVKGIDGRFLLVNKNFCDIFGLNEKDILGKTPFELFPRDVAVQHLENDRQIMQANAPSTFNEQAQLEDRRHEYLSVKFPICDETGSVIAVGGISTDITDRVYAEEMRRTSELKFRKIVDASPMGIHLYELTEDGRLVFIGANSSADRLLGVDHRQFIGKTIEQAFPAIEDTEVPIRYRDAAKDGTLWRTEQINYSEGSISGAFEVVAFQTEPGKMAALFNDITARKKAEVALKESEERLKTLIENTPDAFFVHDMEGKIQLVNEAVCNSLGYRRDELIGMSVLDIVQHMPAEAVSEVWQKVAAGKVVTVESVHRRKDGSSFPVEVRISSTQFGDRTIIFGFARDVTDRKEMEKEKEKYQHQLIQAQKMEAIGTLAGGIAHDFNNLLMGIQGRTSLMSYDLEPSHPCNEHVLAIMEYTRSATALTKQLLGVARGGKYEVTPIDINAAVQTSATLFGRTKKEIRIHSKFYDPPPVVAADRNQIEQVLLNLYVNAWQAMPRGGELYLETAVVSLEEAFCKTYGAKPGRYVRISVTDNGIGMDEATLQRVFDPFFTTKEKARGTGLGLASAYGIIKNHAGIITAYSQLGHGTTFNIYLPLSDRVLQNEEPMKEALLRGSETVLLVDDEEIMIEVGKAMLEKLGYRVLVAQSGEHAVDVVQHGDEDIDLVILDLIMPVMNGGDAFERIREIQPGLPVILSSGYSINGHASEIMKKGCNSFIQKPFSLPELSQKIRKILDKMES